MALSISCKYNGRELSVEDAITLNDGVIRSARKKLVFICVSCGERVKPHRSGKKMAAHFEHFIRNPECELSHKSSSKTTSSQYLDPDSADVIEGNKVERSVMASSRNQKIVLECKQRDNFSCQSCGFRLKVNGIYIIDCHHLKPIKEGFRITDINDLVCLCPNCHRIAHTESPPISFKKIIDRGS